MSVEPIKANGEQEPKKSTSLVDAILAGPLPENLLAFPSTIPPRDPHPLEGIEDVEQATKIIGELLVEERKNQKKKVYPKIILRTQHIVAYMLVNPFASTVDICSFFSISPATLSNIYKSDTFKAMLGKHREGVESISDDLQEQLRQTLVIANERVQEALVHGQIDPNFALSTLDKTANRLGMGNKHQTNVQINNNVITADMIREARARKLANGG